MFSPILCATSGARVQLFPTGRSSFSIIFSLSAIFFVYTSTAVFIMARQLLHSSLYIFVYTAVYIQASAVVSRVMVTDLPPSIEMDSVCLCYKNFWNLLWSPSLSETVVQLLIVPVHLRRRDLSGIFVWLVHCTQYLLLLNDLTVGFEDILRQIVLFSFSKIYYMY